MRKLVWLIFFVAIIISVRESVNVSGRDYLPVLEDGKSWHYAGGWTVGDADSSYYSYTVVGDTIVDNIVAKKLLYETYDYPGYRNSVNVVYEKDGVVYYYDEFLKEFSPAVDFSLTTGDTITTYYDYTVPMYFKVIKEDTITVRGIERRRMAVNLRGYFWNPQYWVEGIGVRGNDGLVVRPTPGGGDIYMLMCCKDGEILFTHNDFSIGVVSSGNDITLFEGEAMPIYDLWGRRVQHPQKGKLYIRASKLIRWE